jgi:zinc-finger-containing domain
MRNNMKCNYCNNDAIWCENKAIYGKNYGKSYMIYLCRPCDAYVGCHQNTKQPLGTMANKELREARQLVHNHIDKYWKKEGWDRKDVYSAMSFALGKTYHTGEADLSTCKKILSFNMTALLNRNNK